MKRAQSQLKSKGAGPHRAANTGVGVGEQAQVPRAKVAAARFQMRQQWHQGVHHTSIIHHVAPGKLGCSFMFVHCIRKA